MQINTTIARHNAHQLPDVLTWRGTWAPMRCIPFCWFRWVAASISPNRRWWPDEYERMLNWFYDQSLTGDIEMKATCAPHYFRVARQRRAADKAAGRAVPPPIAHHPPNAIGPTEMTMPARPEFL